MSARAGHDNRNKAGLTDLEIMNGANGNNGCKKLCGMRSGEAVNRLYQAFGKQQQTGNLSGLLAPALAGGCGCASVP